MKRKLGIIILGALLLLCIAGFAACGVPNDTQQADDFGDWMLITAPGCETAGEETRVSRTDASIVETRPVAATGHTWGLDILNGYIFHGNGSGVDCD